MTATPEHVAAAVDFISRRDWVSFVELQRFAAADLGMEVSGEYVYETAPNAILWAGMSQEFAELVEALHDGDEVTFAAGEWLSYMVDGGALNLPLAKRAPRDPSRGYAQKRWIPTFFRPAAKAAA